MPSPVIKAPNGATHELKNLEVFEVSLVDRPANRRPFLLIKSAETPMPKGQELTPDAEGNLTSTEKGFSAGRKKKLKGSLTSAAKTLSALAEQVDAAEDEDAFMKRVSAIAGTLGGMGGKPKPKEEDKGDAKKEDELPEIAVDALAALGDEIQTAIEAETPAPPMRPEDAARLDKIQAQVETLTKATHTLVSVVKTSSSGARPASQAASAGEVPAVQKSAEDVWKLDMNSNDPDQDEQFL